MIQINPTWRVAQQISRRHTFISLKITLPLLLITLLSALMTLKLLGYAHSGLVLKQFYLMHRQMIVSIIMFLYFIPINFYAIKKVLGVKFNHFEIQLIARNQESNQLEEKNLRDKKNQSGTLTG